MRPVPSDLPAILKDAIRGLELERTKKEIVIAEDYDVTLPQVTIDPSLARVIFQNVISNAIKYADDHGKIKISLKKEGEQAVFSVEDEGCGILDADNPKIFIKFFRAENARENSPDGNELGLYLVKAIIDQFGGKIWFESSTIGNGTKTKGTIFL